MPKSVKRVLWTEQEKDFLYKHYESHGVKFCVDKLGRTKYACKTQWGLLNGRRGKKRR